MVNLQNTLLADGGGGSFTPRPTVAPKPPVTNYSNLPLSVQRQIQAAQTPVTSRPVTSSNTNTNVIQSTGVVPISSSAVNQFRNTPVQSNTDFVKEVGSNIRQGLSNIVSGFTGSRPVQTFDYGNAVVEALESGGYKAGGVTVPKVEGPGEVKTEFIPGEYGISYTPLEFEYEAPATNFPDFQAVSTRDIDSAMEDFLRSSGFTKREDGTWGLDASIYGEQAASLTKTFDQLKQEYNQQYERIRQDLTVQKQQAQRGFRQGQQAISEQGYLNERQLQAALAGRGLGGSGLAQLGQVQQQIARGQQITGLAREYNDVQREIMQEGTRASEDLMNRLTRADLELEQGKLSIAQRQREEENAFKQYLGATRMALEESINNRNYQAYSAEVNRYNAAVSAQQAEFNKKVSLANMELSNIYDDFTFQMDQLAEQFQRAYEAIGSGLPGVGPGTKADKQRAMQAEYDAARETLRRQYEAYREQITRDYGLRR